MECILNPSSRKNCLGDFKVNSTDSLVLQTTFNKSYKLLSITKNVGKYGYMELSEMD